MSGVSAGGGGWGESKDTRKSRTRGGKSQVNVVDGIQADGRHGVLCL